MFWKTYSLEEGKIYYARIGPLEIWIKHYLNDWHIAYKRESAEPGFTELQLPAAVPEEKLSWNRWVLNSESGIITFKPITPDKAVIIRPEIPIRIPPCNRGKFYVNIPVWVNILTGDKEPVSLTDLPVFILSKSWFGDKSSGESCYSKKSYVRKNVEEIENTPCSAICTVKIKNNSKMELNFERFCLNVENLSIFTDNQRLCTNHVDVVFRGVDQESQITISKSHSNILSNCKLLSHPRKMIDMKITRLSYEFFKIFTET